MKKQHFNIFQHGTITYMKNIKKYAAFTLIELIVVIIIIGILASVAVPAYNGYMDQAKEKMNTQLETLLNDAIDNFFVEYGVFPHNTYGNNWDLFNYVKDGYRTWTGSVDHATVILLDAMKTAGVNSYCVDPNEFRGKSWQEITNSPNWPSPYPTFKPADFGIQYNVINGKVESVSVNKNTTQGC